MRDSSLLPELFDRVDEWAKQFPDRRTGSPARGTVAAALVVLEAFHHEHTPMWESLLSKRGGQLAGCGGARVKKIIDRYGSHKDPYSSEGGRTNRGQLPASRAIYKLLTESGVGDLSLDERRSVADALQRHIYETLVKPYYEQQCLSIQVVQDESIGSVVSKLLDEARPRGFEAATAQHIVGAALAQARLIESDQIYATSASDESTARQGDFEIGDMVLHVTTSPGDKLMTKCRENLNQGQRPVIATTPDLVQRTLKVLPGDIYRRVEVVSIPQYVASVLLTAAGVHKARQQRLLKDLLMTYNTHIESTETDRRARVKIPGSLKR